MLHSKLMEVGTFFVCKKEFATLPNGVRNRGGLARITVLREVSLSRPKALKVR